MIPRADGASDVGREPTGSQPPFGSHPTSTGSAPRSALKSAGLSQIGRQGVQLVTTALLTRMLVPADFGLIGMASTIIVLLGLFRDLGTGPALIQRRDLSPSLVASVFWLNSAIGILIGAALWLLAPAGAAFFQEPRLEPVLRILALNPVLVSLGLVHQALLERQLAFRALLRVEMGAVITGAVCGVGLALAGFGVWSLVIQTLAQSVITLVGLWLSSSYRPALVWRWADLRPVARFGIGVSGFALFNYLNRNADYLLIGRFLGTEALGYYTIAYRLMLYPLQSISAVVGRVMYPTYSRLQDDDATIRRLYLKAAGGIAFITLPMVMGIMATTGPLVLTLLGERWAPSIAVLAILAPVGLVQTLATTTGALYQAKGRSDALFAWGAVSSVLYVAGFAVGLTWGIVGVAAAYLGVTLLLAYPVFAIPFRFVGLRVRDLVDTIRRPLALSLVMFCLVTGLSFLLPGEMLDIVRLTILVVTGVTFYGLATWRFDRERVRQVLRMAGASV